MRIKRKVNRAPVQGGSYMAVMVYSIDIGEQLHKYADSSRYCNDVLIGWELCGFTYTEDGQVKPYDLTETYNASLDERSKLRKRVEGWMGRSLSEAELDNFNTDSLIGRPAMLGIVLNEKGYNDIQSIQPIPQYLLDSGMPMPTPTIPFIKFSMEPWDQAAFEALPEWAQKRIKKSTEYQKLHAPVQDVQVQQGQQPAQQPMQVQFPPQMQAFASQMPQAAHFQQPAQQPPQQPVVSYNYATYQGFSPQEAHRAVAQPPTVQQPTAQLNVNPATGEVINPPAPGMEKVETDGQVIPF